MRSKEVQTETQQRFFAFSATKDGDGGQEDLFRR